MQRKYLVLKTITSSNSACMNKKCMYERELLGKKKKKKKN